MQGLNDLFKSVAWTLVCGCCVYAAGQLKDLSTSVAQLNTNVAVLVERITNQERNYESIKAEMASIRARLEKQESISGT